MSDRTPLHTLQTIVSKDFKSAFFELARSRKLSASQMTGMFITKGLLETVAQDQASDEERARVLVEQGFAPDQKAALHLVKMVPATGGSRELDERRATLEERLVAEGYVGNPEDAQFAMALIRMYLGDGLDDEIKGAGGLEAFETRLMAKLTERLIDFHTKGKVN